MVDGVDVSVLSGKVSDIADDGDEICVFAPGQIISVD